MDNTGSPYRRKLGHWNLLRHLSRAFLVASTIGVFFGAYLAPFQIQREPDFSLGAVFLVLTVLAWIWPEAGGLLFLLWGFPGLFSAISHLESSPDMRTVGYVLIPALMVAGGAGNLGFAYVRHLYQPRPRHAVNRIRWLARAVALAVPIIGGLMYGTVLAMPALIFAGIAWFWPAAGGVTILMWSTYVLLAVPLLNSPYFGKLPAYALCFTFAASGVLHLVIAWRQKRRGAAQ